MLRIPLLPPILGRAGSDQFSRAKLNEMRTRTVASADVQPFPRILIVLMLSLATSHIYDLIEKSTA